MNKWIIVFSRQLYENVHVSDRCSDCVYEEGGVCDLVIAWDDSDDFN